MTYYRFHVRRKEVRYIKPFHRMPYVVYNYNQVKTMEEFVKKTEKLFEGKPGTYILYNDHNQSVIRFTMGNTKMVVINKTNTLGFTYRLFKRWNGERVQLTKKYE